MSHALVPAALTRPKSLNSTLVRALVVLVGALALSALAQITIRLPWTPVPITGITFGVALAGLTLGRRLAFATMTAYLTAGLCGLPVLAGGAAFNFGATSGYLFGMLIAALVIGDLADRGRTGTWWSALGATCLGSVITYACGLLVLAKFVPAPALLAAGVWPFLLGDLIKNGVAATVARAAHRA